MLLTNVLFFFFQAEDGIRDLTVTGVQTCALPIFRGVREKANGMKTYGELLGRMTGSTPSLAIEVYKRPEASGLTADDGNHERKSEHSCADERFRRAADTDPYGERILQRAGVDCLAGK